jgi:DNA-binding transcriptional ArsR family regulator
MTTPRKIKRHNIYRRILLLVDTLAPLRCGITSTEACKRINERMGEAYNRRTVSRDLEALYELGYVRFEVRKLGPKQMYSRFWILNLAKSENLQQIAFEQVEAK